MTPRTDDALRANIRLLGRLLGEVLVACGARIEGLGTRRLVVHGVRSLRPIDTGTIVESVKKTSRVLIVEEGWPFAGIAAEIATQVVERAFDWLDAPPARVKAFFGVGHDVDAPSCKIGWIRVPGGAVLEIFQFQPQQPPVAVPWNRVGLTHISFNVRNTRRWYEYLKSKGVECVSAPERSPRGHTFFFAKDFDGNLIEISERAA